MMPDTGYQILHPETLREEKMSYEILENSID
jgi:hypothetical protein